MNKIIIETPMSQLTTEQQEEVWKLARNNEVYEKDVNGVLWRILDFSGGDKEFANDLVLIKTKENDADK